CRGNAGAAGARQPRSIRPVREYERDFGWVVFAPRRLDQRDHVRSAPGDQHGDALFRHRGGHDRSRRPLNAMALPASLATTSPSATTFSPCVVRHAMAAFAFCGSSTATMPMPQLKVRSISFSPTLPVAASHLNTGKTGT